jgi:hypothetical protein
MEIGSQKIKICINLYPITFPYMLPHSYMIFHHNSINKPQNIRKKMVQQAQVYIKKIQQVYLLRNNRDFYAMNRPTLSSN